MATIKGAKAILNRIKAPKLDVEIPIEKAKRME
jgi:hypothetical protein